MKFKVSPKDFLIFILFCIFLFYLCAIGVINLSYFGKTGEIYGLNPLLAFTKDYFAATIIIFFLVLIVIFSSVSSYIFSKEKGKGLGLAFGEKSEKGYSRWATEKEIKNDKDVEHILITDENTQVAGIPLINDGKNIWLDNGEYHNLVIGSTGSGKTETVVKPMVNILAKKGESMIIMDPKGEIYKYSGEYLKQRGYKIHVLNFRDPHFSAAWNPLTLPYKYMKDDNHDKGIELLDDVALNILYDPNNKNDGGFWEKSAADYFSGLALGLIADAKEEEININSISLMASIADEKFAGSNYGKEYFGLKGEKSSAYIFASNTINAPADTKGGITSVFRQKIRQFAAKDDLSEMLSHSDFDMRDIGKEKTAIFIVIHDEKTTYHGLATIFIKQCYETLVDEAQKNGGKLPFRTNFILDEFANMPPLKDVDAMVTAARSRDIRFTFIIQNFGQLKDIYGEKAGTIKGNCGNLIYLMSTELSALEEISKMAGEVKSGDKDKTASTPLISVTDLQKMKLFEILLIRWRMYPFRTKFIPDFELDWKVERKMAEFTRRETKEIQIFDMKEFVKEEKRKRLFDSIEQNPNPETKALDPGVPNMPPMFGGNPMGGGMPANFDIDAMIKSIDEKIAELDAEEERKKKELDAKQKGIVNEPMSEISKEEIVQTVSEEVFKPIEEPKVDETVIEEKIEPANPELVKEEVLVTEEIIENKEPIKEVAVEEKQEEILEPVMETETKQEEIKIAPKPKPVVNVDTDSVIVDDTVITDDEFFDDFFGDD